MRSWCVKTAYWYDEESPRDTLECDVKMFESEKDAVKELRRAIREDWTSEVEVNGRTRLLANCRGKSERDTVKWSDWYYSEDGKLAWFYHKSGGGYKGWVEEIEVPEPKMSKDAAAMREALDGIVGIAKIALNVNSFGNNNNSELWKIIDRCKSALSLPPRKCDIRAGGPIGRATLRHKNQNQQQLNKQKGINQ